MLPPPRAPTNPARVLRFQSCPRAESPARRHLRTLHSLQLLVALLVTATTLTGCVRIGPCGAHFYAPWMEDFGGGDGASIAKAITIRRASSEHEAIAKEEDYVEPSRIQTRTTITRDKKVYHLITISGHRHGLSTFYFDVTKALRN